MKEWNAFPMLRLIVPIMLGLVISAFGLEVFMPKMLHIAITVVIVLAFVVVMALVGRRSRSQLWFGVLLWPCSFLCGALLMVSVSDYLFPDYFTQTSPEGTPPILLLRVIEEPQEKENSLKVIAEAVDAECMTHGRILLYLKKDTAMPKIEFGNLLAVRTRLQRVTGLRNPNEFNYPRYLRFHNIFFRGYAASGDWERLSTGKPGLKGKLLRFRARLMSKFRSARLENDDLAVASALILGYRADIDKDLMTAYAGAGATHVLAVSGLHVGIVYIILNALLAFLNKTWTTRMIKTVLLMMLLFGYAALTGMSASVFRAATMFSFVAFGRLMNRDTSIFNTLAASAFCLVLFDPLIIMQVGFQLSYAAVIGIVIIQPLLFNLISFRHRAFDWAWSISCVSIAAQLTTFPLGLLYFHQFPNLFLLSNLLVIPAAAGILYVGFMLFVFSFWQPTLLFFGEILHLLISSLNRTVRWIESLPFSIWTGIDISIFESLLIYGLIIAALTFIMKRRLAAFYLALGLTGILLLVQVIEIDQQQHQEFITVYNVRGETAMALVKGTQATFIARRELWEDSQRMLFHVRHHWWNKGVEQVHFVEMNDSIFNRELVWDGVHFAVLDLNSTNKASVEWLKDTLDFAVLHRIAWKRCGDLASSGLKDVYVSNNIGIRTYGRLKTAAKNLHLVDIRNAGSATAYVSGRSVLR